MEINIIYNSILPEWTVTLVQIIPLREMLGNYNYPSGESNIKLPAIIFKDRIAGSLSYCRLQPQRLSFSGAVQYPVSSH